jgi:hypothetical protein
VVVERAPAYWMRGGVELHLTRNPGCVICLIAFRLLQLAFGSITLFLGERPRRPSGSSSAPGLFHRLGCCPWALAMRA